MTDNFFDAFRHKTISNTFVVVLSIQLLLPLKFFHLVRHENRFLFYRHLHKISRTTTNFNPIYFDQNCHSFQLNPYVFYFFSLHFLHIGKRNDSVMLKKMKKKRHISIQVQIYRSATIKLEKRRTNTNYVQK